MRYSHHESRRSRVTVRAILAFFVLAGACFGQMTGFIEGTVVDPTGALVGDATVYAHPMGVVMSSIVPHAVTDSSGHYSLRVRLGQYSLAAGKPEEGYPDPLYYTFYFGYVKAPEVTLTNTHDRAVVDLRLGKKAGVLSGTVRDASSGKPIDANVDFRWISDSHIFLSGSGLTNAVFRILVPSDTPLSMVVSQVGYEDWAYSIETQTGLSTAVLLHPGESMNLDIRLKPKSSSGVER